MKKTVIILIGLFAMAGCSNTELIDCNTERQKLRLQVDELNQKVNDMSIASFQDKTNAELKIANLESILKRTQVQLEEANLKLEISLPELQKAHDQIKEQLEIANEAIRQELAKNLAFQKDNQQLKDEIKKLTEAVTQKDELLKEANKKLGELTVLLEAKNQTEITE